MRGEQVRPRSSPPCARASSSLSQRRGGRGPRTSSPRRSATSCAHELVAQPVDVHGGARGEVAQLLHELRGAGGAGAADDGALLVPRRGGAADGALRWGRRRAAASGGRLPSTTLTISGMTSPARRMKTVSPLRTSLRRSSSSLCSVARDTVTPPTFTGFEMRDRRERAGAAHVHLDVLHQRGLLLGRELVGHGPARALGHLAQPPAQVLAVHLHHHAVDLEGQGVAALERARGTARAPPPRPRRAARGG